MSKGLLAQNPHQETVYDIVDFKWRLCVNYIKLNQVTLVMILPITHCDSASIYEFGDGRSYWLLDLPMRYHQVEFNVISREKLEFAGPNTSMYTYRVMPRNLGDSLRGDKGGPEPSRTGNIVN